MYPLDWDTNDRFIIHSPLLLYLKSIWQSCFDLEASIAPPPVLVICLMKILPYVTSSHSLLGNMTETLASKGKCLHNALSSDRCRLSSCLMEFELSSLLHGFAQQWSSKASSCVSLIINTSFYVCNPLVSKFPRQSSSTDANLCIQTRFLMRSIHSLLKFG